MKTAIFEYGKQSLAEWIKENRDCEKMVLVGNVYCDLFDDNYSYKIEDGVYGIHHKVNIGWHSFDLLYGFEEIAGDFHPVEFDISNMHLLDFEGNIDDNELASDIADYQPSKILRMLANRKYGTLFVYNNGIITTPDKKVLIHYDTITQNIQIPEGFETIGRLAFAGINELRGKEKFSVILPNGIKIIEEYAFMHSNLIKINFPDSLRLLGEFAFDGAELTEVLLPDEIEEIPSCCFSFTWIEKLHLPSNLKAVRNAAFIGLYCDEIRLPQNVEIVESEAFCGEYKKIYVPKTIKNLASDFYYEEGIDDHYEDHKPIIIEY